MSINFFYIVTYERDGKYRTETRQADRTTNLKVLFESEFESQFIVAISPCPTKKEAYEIAQIDNEEFYDHDMYLRREELSKGNPLSRQD